VLHISHCKTGVINRVLLAGRLGPRKQNLKLRLQQTLTSIQHLSLFEAGEAGDRPELADLTPAA